MGNNERVAIKMDVLDDIICDLNNNVELQRIFGIPVSAALIVVADANDLRIEEAGVVNLTGDQKNTFLRILDEVIQANSAA
jgi:hypothetical protein